MSLKQMLSKPPHLSKTSFFNPAPATPSFKSRNALRKFDFPEPLMPMRIFSLGFRWMVTFLKLKKFFNWMDLIMVCCPGSYFCGKCRPSGWINHNPALFRSDWISTSSLGLCLYFPSVSICKSIRSASGQNSDTERSVRLLTSVVASLGVKFSNPTNLFG